MPDRPPEGPQTEELPYSERLTTGARVLVSPEDRTDHAFQNKHGTFLEYTAPRGAPARMACLHLDGDPETAHVLVFSRDLKPERAPERDLIRTWSRSGFTLRLYDTHRSDRDGKAILAYQLFDKENGDGSIFDGADFHCSPLHAVDSDRTVASLLTFLSLKPGDTDREHFEDYTERQLTWCQARGEELSWLAHLLELPYRPVDCAVGHESWDEAAAAGRYNRSLALSYQLDGKDHRVTLKAGESDNVEVFTDGTDVYVLTTNSRLGYMGLEAFRAGEEIGDVFLQSDDVEETLGEDAWDLGWAEILEQLVEHLPDPPPFPTPPRERGKAELTADSLRGLSTEVRERIQTFLRLGLENPWVRKAVDPPFNGLSCRVCADVDELAEMILRGNWCLGQAFVLGDLCFINQLDGGDEWLTIKGATAFESITMQLAGETREHAEQRLRGTVARLQAASEEQCERLDY